MTTPVQRDHPAKRHRHEPELLVGTDAFAEPSSTIVDEAADRVRNGAVVLGAKAWQVQEHDLSRPLVGRAHVTREVRREVEPMT
jgi:hypothetical protein